MWSACSLVRFSCSLCALSLLPAAANARFEEEVERGAQNWSRMSNDLSKTMVRCAAVALWLCWVADVLGCACVGLQ